MEQIVVGMGDCRVAAGQERSLATYALGSCIGLVLYDYKAMIGGLLHYMLPDSGLDSERAKNSPYVFADTGIPLLFQTMRDLGANKRNLIAYAAGGAAMMETANMFEIGKRNHQALRKMLWKLGLLLNGESIGGSVSRTVRLEVGTGRLWLQQGSAPRDVVSAFKPGSPAATVSTPIQRPTASVPERRNLCHIVS